MKQLLYLPKNGDTTPLWDLSNLSNVEKAGKKIIKSFFKNLSSPIFSFSANNNKLNNSDTRALDLVQNTNTFETAPPLPVSNQATTLNGIISYRKKVETAIESLMASIELKKNRFKLNGIELHSVMANKKVLGLILKSLFTYLNEKNYGQEINLQIVDDCDYTLLVAEHYGTPLSHVELRNLYQKPTSQIKDAFDSMLYSCLHTLKICGGWLTAGKKGNSINYITLGIPKNL